MPITLTECPRDAMQGLKDFVPTELKIQYINAILDCGFQRVDFGSFVSPKAIPQMRDTSEVLSQLHLQSQSQLLAIIANERGAEDAVQFGEIYFLGYPFSVSETFQLRNTNATIEESMKRVENIQNLCQKNNKQLMLYLSMAFGNPYGDPWHGDIVAKWVEKLSSVGIKHFSLADTVGVSTVDNIKSLYNSISQSVPNLEVGVHLHSRNEEVIAKIEAAYKSGCRHFDMAIQGFGGCPMAADSLVGNINTNIALSYFDEMKIEHGISEEKFKMANTIATTIFGQYH
jgi:hydroxymethylglutaryl-CoA lyase